MTLLFARTLQRLRVSKHLFASLDAILVRSCLVHAIQRKPAFPILSPRPSFNLKAASISPQATRLIEWRQHAGAWWPVRSASHKSQSGGALPKLPGKADPKYIAIVLQWLYRAGGPRWTISGGFPTNSHPMSLPFAFTWEKIFHQEILALLKELKRTLVMDLLAIFNGFVPTSLILTF